MAKNKHKRLRNIATKSHTQTTAQQAQTTKIKNKPKQELSANRCALLIVLILILAAWNINWVITHAPQSGIQLVGGVKVVGNIFVLIAVVKILGFSISSRIELEYLLKIATMTATLVYVSATYARVYLSFGIFDKNGVLVHDRVQYIFYSAFSLLNYNKDLNPSEKIKYLPFSQFIIGIIYIALTTWLLQKFIEAKRNQGNPSIA